jgi:hypothetical protein
MDQEVVLIVNGEEYQLGTAGELLSQKAPHTSLHNAIRDIVDELIFDPNSNQYVTCSVEVR